MIEITRSLARKLVAVLQKSVWAASGRKRIPPVLFRTGPQGLAVSTQYEGLAVRYTQRGGHRGDILAVPGQILQACAGEGKTPVRLEQLGADRGIASWEDGKQSHDQEFSATDPESMVSFPESPEDLRLIESNFLAALHDAEGCTAGEDGRFALTYAQLRGAGVIVGTDGKQLLWQTGFSFPWEDDPLVQPTRVFGSKALKRKPVSLGRTATHVVVRCEAWTVALPVKVGLKFPNAEDIIMNLSTDRTRWHVPSDEAAFLIRYLPRIPFEEYRPAVTLDLSPLVRLRSRDQDNGRGMELILQRSTVVGPPLQLTSNPRYLLRALKLGFRTFHHASGQPEHSRDGHRLYAWMPLDFPPLEPNDEDERIYSSERSRRSR